MNASTATNAPAINGVTMTAALPSVLVPAGPFVYNFTLSSTNDTVSVAPIVPGTVTTTSTPSTPSVLVIEKKDNNGLYNGYFVSTEQTNYVGPYQATDTWGNGSAAVTRYSNNKLSDRGDKYGVISTTDTSNSDQSTITLSVPASQIAEYLVIAANGAVLTPGSTSTGSSTQLGDVLVKDSEVSGVSSKNLIVVGGSCINSVAANLLGAPACSADFTTATGVGTGQFLIKSFTSPYATGKIALLVAGYEASDTVNAATYLRTQVVDTTVGKKYIGTSGTTATLTTNSQ